MGEQCDEREIGEHCAEREFVGSLCFERDRENIVLREDGGTL